MSRNRRLTALFGLKWDPFSADVPSEAFFRTPQTDLFFSRVESSVEMQDVTGGFVKSVVFALVVATISCYQGYYTHTRAEGFGAKGVSSSTTSAVVICCVMILVTDYIMTSFLL